MKSAMNCTLANFHLVYKYLCSIIKFKKEENFVSFMFLVKNHLCVKPEKYDKNFNITRHSLA